MKTVLVVDDEPQIRRALCLNLAARGYEVVEATTGEVALAQLKALHPDVVLLDLGLPDMDGVFLVDSIRQWSDVPVVVLTVRDDEQSKAAAFEAGADDYITKPFEMAELADRIAVVLRPDADGCRDHP
ncbi:MAG: two-component system, OmpR family, operon response regulator KdpE [Ilumatobacteraceae bacterium]|jgi:two-component system KDP operon response regulator KdpE